MLQFILNRNESGGIQMTLNQIEYFITIVENNTYLEASEILNISQSSLSKQIILLEKELDIKLFDRSKRSAALTDAGKVFYQDALQMQALHSEISIHLKPYTQSHRSHIYLGTLPFLTQYKITPIIKRFTEIYPDIHVTIEEVEDEHLMYGLRHNDYDLAITRKGLLKENLYKSYHLVEDKLVVVLPESHPFSKYRAISIEELKNEKFIFMNKHISIYHLCVDICRKGGFEPNIIRTARVESILSAVASGEGISILCSNNFNVFSHSNIAVIPLGNPVTTSVVIARIAKEKISGSTKLFINYLKNNYEYPQLAK